SLYAVPIVILYPIFTAWLGIGSPSKIAFAGVYGFFPVMLSTAAGIQSIDQNFLIAARSMVSSLPQQVARVIIPASIPTVLAARAARPPPPAPRTPRPSPRAAPPAIPSANTAPCSPARAGRRPASRSRARPSHLHRRRARTKVGAAAAIRGAAANVCQFGDRQ